MKLLTKGIEEEVYTGHRDGTLVGVSHKVAADIPQFQYEPDCRNAEYATHPWREYEYLTAEIKRFRCQLLRYLRAYDDLVMIPGSSLLLGDSSEFVRSDPSNPYHSVIEDKYFTDVVTASIHINIGIDDQESLIRACRVARCEAFVYLALTACSPFLDGKVTGFHSTRWHKFPHTPKTVPLFTDQAHYISWVEEKIKTGEMFNTRHLWNAVRPNGVGAPYDVQRLELRICDRVDRVDQLVGMTALFEARVHRILAHPETDPLTQSPFSPEELVTIINDNEAAVAKDSLNAMVVDWQSGDTIKVLDFAKDYIATAKNSAAILGFKSWIEPIEEILESGNPAMRWLARHAAGESIRDIVQSEIIPLNTTELETPCCDGDV